MTIMPQPRRLPLLTWAVLLLCFGLVSAALAFPADQAEEGSKVYAERCSTCHGDVGQGLTDEFRATWAEGDRNCWIPSCHGANHPKPTGFSIPRYVPAVVGPGTLARFANAQALHAFIKADMPMQEPGVLSDDEYWALTAFLLRENGVAADGQRLDASTAPRVAVPRSGQPVPKPNRDVTDIRMMPMSPRDRAVTARPTPTPPVTLQQAASLSTGAAAGAAQEATTQPAAEAPRPNPAAALYWAIALAVGLGSAGFALAWLGRHPQARR